MINIMRDEYVLITGSSRGLGRYLALTFALHGFNVILHGRDKARLCSLKRRINKINVKCLIIKGDLRKKSVLNRLIKTAISKNVKILINNAGLHCPGVPISEIKNAQINNILSVNLIVPIKIIKALYPVLSTRKNSVIININSISGIRNQMHRTVYCASKWGLRGFSDTLKLENKNKIKIIDVYPGRIKTKSSFTYGLDPALVARKIFDSCKRAGTNKIIAR